MTPYGCLVERVGKLFLSIVSGKWRKIITPIAAIAVLSAFLFFPRGQAGSQLTVEGGQSPIIDVIQEQLQEEQLIERIEAAVVTIMVDIQGAVKYPGVYSLMEGDRLIDAIHAAGGYLADADSRMLNHAMKLPDEFFIYVPREGEEVDFSTPSGSFPPQQGGGVKDDGKVNINTADVQELMTIPGIGPSKAAAILQYREEHGPFISPEAIMEVSGIGQKTFEKLESFITAK
ncbi:helix-hairpin-helix domain-containing protein [Sporosarcina luteola]|uniref:helix-hairpin-helix domain-containing protein n=1 Tax=Sporosarcina luteola TaxID=582850 RepID=UPI00203A47BE|nr:helix-hairpin-helix domain-containing protein [Sporosarcina luteola]MCM3710830.1 helix-hairpin-helix domain-containing protein [Sporosarcina luteola]